MSFVFIMNCASVTVVLYYYYFLIIQNFKMIALELGIFLSHGGFFFRFLFSKMFSSITYEHYEMHKPICNQHTTKYHHDKHAPFPNVRLPNHKMFQILNSGACHYKTQKAPKKQSTQSRPSFSLSHAYLYSTIRTEGVTIGAGESGTLIEWTILF